MTCATFGKYIFCALKETSRSRKRELRADERFCELRGLLKPKGALIRAIINVCILHVSRVCLDAWHVAGPLFVQARMANRTASPRRVSSPPTVLSYVYALHCTRCTHPTRANDVRMFSTRGGLAIGRAISLSHTHTRLRCKDAGNADFYMKQRSVW